MGKAIVGFTMPLDRFIPTGRRSPTKRICKEWAPFEADGSLGTLGTTVKLTTVGAFAPRVTWGPLRCILPVSPPLADGCRSGSGG
ncbi:MAG TPA: hypothetical protein VN924_33185 [Bryobacteraceae bacterium]|jgi:hypothetical protein|nr:hypothetical protein [Bryobacteraceae bacterium]